MKKNDLKAVFMKAAAKHQYADLESAIKSERHDLENETFVSAGYGYMAHTLLTTHEVFKGPVSNDPDKIDKFEKEIVIQAFLSQAGVPYTAAVTAVGQEAYFYGMARLPGVPLKDIKADMSPEDTAAMAVVVAEVKSAVDAAFAVNPIPMPDDREEKQFTDAIAFWNGGAVKGQPVKAVIKSLDPRLFKALEEYVPRLSGRTPVLLHKDFNDTNIMLDPETRQVTAVIDWGAAQASHVPEREFTAMRRHHDAPFIKTVATHYQGAGFKPRDVVCYRALVNVFKRLSGTDKMAQKWVDQRIDGLAGDMLAEAQRFKGLWPHRTICGKKI